MRVPGLLVWPAKIAKARSTEVPCITSDYVPTVLDALNIDHPNANYAIDGISLMPLIENSTKDRQSPIGFMFKNRLVMNSDNYKLISYDGGKTFQLYNMQSDRVEQKNIASQKPEILSELKKKFDVWQESVRRSFEGEEYGRKSFDRLKQKWQSPTTVKVKSKSKKKKKSKKNNKENK